MFHRVSFSVSPLVAAPELVPLDVQSLRAPLEVPLPTIRFDAPPFVAKDGWLDETVDTIEKHYFQADASMGDYRKPPMALVRCSRGGKTRALFEITRAFRTRHANCAVIFISFNDQTMVKDWEQADPVGAICRRIAFAAWKGGNTFDQFCSTYSVDSNDIIRWLGKSFCLLLIDELNQLSTFQSTSNRAGSGFTVANFIKEHFLLPQNRFLVFSSHVLSTTGELTAYMETASSRQVILRELPLIPSLQVAKNNFNWQDLNAREVLYYGKVPALIYEARWEAQEMGHLPTAKRNQAIRDCVSGGFVTEEGIRKLFTTFLTGNVGGVFPPLLQLMTTVSQDHIQWIPFHMMAALETFSCEHGLKRLEAIVRLFHAFKEAKVSSGDGWESLFVAVLLIRCWSQSSDECILPFVIGETCTFSYNEPFNGNFATQRVAEFLTGIQPPSSFPHVAVYYPAHASFPCYDVIVAHYDPWEVRRLYGYQLKEGKAPPKEGAMSDFERSFVIRGEAARMTGMGNDWVRPSADGINAFFGVSGQHWTPQEWKKLGGL